MVKEYYVPHRGFSKIQLLSSEVMFGQNGIWHAKDEVELASAVDHHAIALAKLSLETQLSPAVRSKINEALGMIGMLAASPSLRLLGPQENHWKWMDSQIRTAAATANLAFDAQIAAIMLEHRVTEFLTSDGDFRRFKDLKVTNPFES